MRRESRAAHSELVGLATDVMGLIQRAQWTREKGATLNSTPFRVNFIQKLRAWLLMKMRVPAGAFLVLPSGKNGRGEDYICQSLCICIKK